MKKYKRYLAAVWFLGAGIVFLLLVLQTQLGHFGDNDTDVWGWFLPTVMPTLSLIIGVLVMDAFGKGVTTANPDSFLFKLALGLSCFYLVVVLLTILLQPFVATPALKMMQKSHLYLGPLQGLVAAALSAFFVSK
jgi:hypothetical protein